MRDTGILAEVHQHPFSQAERQIYIESLIAGVTGRSKKVILMEMDHILREVYDEDKKEFASLLSMIRERNKELYTGLLCGGDFQKEQSEYSRRM